MNGVRVNDDQTYDDPVNVWMICGNRYDRESGDARSDDDRMICLMNVVRTSDGDRTAL